MNDKTYSVIKKLKDTANAPLISFVDDEEVLYGKPDFDLPKLARHRRIKQEHYSGRPVAVHRDAHAAATHRKARSARLRGIWAGAGAVLTAFRLEAACRRHVRTGCVSANPRISSKAIHKFDYAQPEPNALCWAHFYVCITEGHRAMALSAFIEDPQELATLIPEDFSYSPEADTNEATYVYIGERD